MIRAANLRSGYIQDDVEQYLYELLPERDAVASEMELYAEQHRVPIIGPAVARLLALFVEVSGAKRIFEMGSAIGYSTIWLARAAGPKGKVHYTDGDPANAQRARGYFRRAGLAKRIDVQVGDALELLKKTPGKFDLIFNDIDKHAYPESLPVIQEKLRPGGVLIVDNLLWHGQIFDATDQTADTTGVRDFTRRMTTDPGWITTIVPIRDGVLVAYKV